MEDSASVVPMLLEDNATDVPLAPSGSGRVDADVC